MEQEIQDSTAVSAGVSGEDPAGPVIYAWSASDGTFANPTLAATIYSCPRGSHAGPQIIAVSAVRGTCTVSQQLVVICAPPASSDTGLGGSIGARGVGGGAGAANPDAGPSMPDGGGTGDAEEVGPASDGGGEGGGGFMPPACGAGDSTIDEGNGCNRCTLANCTTLESVGPRATVSAGCHHLSSDADRVHCQDLYCCMRAHRCVIDGDPSPCWCGDADPTACALGTEPATGPCLAEMQAAAGITDPAQIAQRLVDPSLAIGGAVNLAICRASYCASPPSPACYGFPN